MTRNNKRAYIAFGANLANPCEMLLRVVEALALRGLEVEAVAPLYRSAAWPPGTGAPDYLNTVLAVRTAFGAAQLMTLLLRIEAQLGRARTTPNAPRVVDLDLLDLDGMVSDDPHVTLPHPRMTARDFVLLPLADIAPDWVHPDGRPLRALLASLTDARSAP